MRRCEYGRLERADKALVPRLIDRVSAKIHRNDRRTLRATTVTNLTARRSHLARSASLACLLARFGFAEPSPGRVSFLQPR